MILKPACAGSATS